MLEAKIKFNNVSKMFKNSAENPAIIENISFEIFAEEFVCILGPSGSGKTTILNLIAGFIKPTEGEVLFNSRPITRPDSSRTLVFQDYALFPWLNVIDNVAFGLFAKKIKKEEARKNALKYLDLVGLSSYKDYTINSLSGGMKQRVAIARAMSVEPEVMLLDEPFGALDQHTREAMQNELLRLWTKSKKTVIFITHSIDEAIKLADRVIVIGGKPGKVLYDTTISVSRPRDLNDSKLALVRESILNKLTYPEQYIGADI